MTGKPDPSMTPAEIADFLGRNSIGIACARDAGGRLVARMVRYGIEAGDVHISRAADAAALPAGPGACFLVDTYPAYDEIRGVMLRGALEPQGDALVLHPTRSSGFDFRKVPKLG